jgi:hypothetical protein
MKIESYGRAIWRLARSVLIINLVIAIVTALVCWLGGWRTLHDFGVGLMIGGFVGFVLGGASAFGGVNVASNPTYRYVQSVSPNSLHERTKQNWLDLQQSWGFFTLMIVAGILSIAAGWLITALVR